MFDYEAGLKEILGDYYEDVKAFFYKCIYDGEYEYKVFMSRRCFVLFQLFMLVFQNEGREVDQGGQIIITDKGIIRYREGLNQAKKILLVDDILIYGRTIEKVYLKLRQWAPRAGIDVFVYIKNSGKLCIKDKELLDSLKARFVEETREWRSFSNKLVYCIYYANMPYTSFVNSYYNKVTEEDFNAFNEKFSLYKNYSVANRFQQKYGLSAQVIFPEEMQEKYPLFNRIARKCCIRVYYNSNIGKLLLIPYVFLKEMSLSSLTELSETYAGLMPEFKESLSENTEMGSEDMAAYKARMLTCIFSFIYGRLFFSEMGINVTEWQNDYDTVQKSFDSEVARELFDLSMERMQEIASDRDFAIPSVDPVIQTWYTVDEMTDFQRKGNMQKDVYTYFRMEGNKDEIRAQEGRERMTGSTMAAVLDFFGEKHDEGETYACLMNAWDTGYASFDWAVSSDHKYLAGFNMSGEQNFRQIIEENPLFFHDISLIYSKVVGRAFYRKTLDPLLDEFHQKVEKYCDTFEVSQEVKNYALDRKVDLRKFMVKDIIDDMLDNITEEHADRWIAFCNENL